MNTSLYVHIPFCLKKCGYCDFFSLAAQDPSIQRRVLDRILEEIADFVSAASPPRFPSVFIGGGTPSSVPLGLFAPFLMELSRRVFSLPAPRGEDETSFEWTVECNPESLTPAHLDLFRAAGITRISLGIQSLQDEVLKRSGRLGSARKAETALELLSKRWRGGEASFGADFIAGLPGETENSLIGGLETALSAGASHISLYSLSLEEGTPFAERAGVEPRFVLSEDERDGLWFAGRDFLLKSGFVHYEVSNFAEPGRECLHNLGYWDLHPYFGAGPAAVSCFPMEEGRARIIARPRNLEKWLKGDFEEEKILAKDFLVENLLMAFRTKRGLSREIFRERFGAAPENRIGRTIEKWAKMGMINDSGGRIALDERGMCLLNRFLVDCMSELEGKD